MRLRKVAEAAQDNIALAGLLRKLAWWSSGFRWLIRREKREPKPYGNRGFQGAIGKSGNRFCRTDALVCPEIAL